MPENRIHKHWMKQRLYKNVCIILLSLFKLYISLLIFLCKSKQPELFFRLFANFHIHLFNSSKASLSTNYFATQRALHNESHFKYQYQQTKSFL